MKEHFSHFYADHPDRLHFAAHSHHPWPDTSYEAHQQYWLDSARHVDDKWDHVLGEVIPETQGLIADLLGMSNPDSMVFAPNTHNFLVRIFSCFESPVRVLSSASEFHSFTRQSRRWEEAGLAIVDRVETEPYETFQDRFRSQVEAGMHDLVYVSSVFYDSGFVVDDMASLVTSAPNDSTFFVVDGYHQFMAMPTNISAIENRAFFLAGGYKYAMAGEGACFLHCPPGYGERPVDTGWYAGFGQLESGVSDNVFYGEDGSRFGGATYDPSGIYRLRSVLKWIASMGIGPDDIHQHVITLQDRFLDSEPDLGELIPSSGQQRGNFLTFRSDQAGDRYQSLHDRGVITDFRGDRLRLGFGIYQDISDVDRLIEIVSTIR